MPNPQAWIEFPSGERIPIEDTCTIGRAAGNRVVIPSERVSRRHAVIRRQEDGSYQIMDFGSSNGTYLNGQRQSRPATLANGAVIEIGMQKMIFRALQNTARADSEATQVPCWLVLLDAAQLGYRDASQELSDKTFESWSARCERVVRKYRGETVRAMNEGFLAYWRALGPDNGAAAIAAVLRSLRAVQMQQDEFRFGVHFGETALKAGMTGDPKPTGDQVIYLLQLQRLMRTAIPKVLISASAHSAFGQALPLRLVAAPELHDYKGSERFYTLADGNATNAG